MLTDYKFWRKFKGGIWYYVRPYDNLHSFQHMRYWINRNPLSNEVILNEETYYKGKGQSTFIFCPKCSIEMVSNDYCIKDADLVYFDCENCGNKSDWNFDIAPVPMLLRSDDGQSEIKHEFNLKDDEQNEKN